MGFGTPSAKGLVKIVPFPEASKVFQSLSSYQLNDSTSEIIDMAQYAENLSSFALPIRP